MNQRPDLLNKRPDTLNLIEEKVGNSLLSANILKKNLPTHTSASSGGSHGICGVFSSQSAKCLDPTRQAPIPSYAAAATL